MLQKQSLVALLVIGLAAVSMSASTNNCTFERESPDRFRANFVATLDGKNMAKFTGYIATNDSRYLIVNAESLRVDRDEGKIYLADKCVDFELDYSENARGIASISNLKWNFRDAPHSSKPYGHCTASLFAHKFPFGEQRYSCLEEQRHFCLTESRDGLPVMIAKLVLEVFELEIDGNEDKINAGDYSKQRFQQSCWE